MTVNNRVQHAPGRPVRRPGGRKQCPQETQRNEPTDDDTERLAAPILGSSNGAATVFSGDAELDTSSRGGRAATPTYGCRGGVDRWRLGAVRGNVATG